MREIGNDSREHRDVWSLEESKNMPVSFFEMAEGIEEKEDAGGRDVRSEG